MYADCHLRVITHTATGCCCCCASASLLSLQVGAVEELILTELKRCAEEGFDVRTLLQLQRIELINYFSVETSSVVLLTTASLVMLVSTCV
jgi:hypothetical protein